MQQYGLHNRKRRSSDRRTEGNGIIRKTSLLAALLAAGSDGRKAMLEDVQAVLEAMRSKEDGSPVRVATVNI